MMRATNPDLSKGYMPKEEVMEGKKKATILPWSTMELLPVHKIRMFQPPSLFSKIYDQNWF